MIYLPICDIQEGMILARDINSNDANKFSLPLIRKGNKLTYSVIEKLKQQYVIGVYVEQDGTEDIIQESVIDNQLRIETLAQIKKVFDTFQNPKNKNVSGVVDEVIKVAEDLCHSITSKTAVLINLIELKNHDDYTFTHSLCVSILSIATGITLGYDDEKLSLLATAALLHDIGKVDTPTWIINKPDELTEEEFEIMKLHPAHGAEMLDKQRLVPFPTILAIKWHHEKYDGTGYPQGVVGEQIHPFARIIAICDVYDALTSNRAYRKAWEASEAIEHILAGSQTHFDYKYVKAFLKKIVVYPVGSIVVLSNGLRAIVVKNNVANTLRPLVRVVDSECHKVRDIDLMNDSNFYNLTIASRG